MVQIFFCTQDADRYFGSEKCGREDERRDCLWLTEQGLKDISCIPDFACNRLYEFEHITSFQLGVKEQASLLQVSLTQSAVLGIPCDAVSRDYFSQPQGESKRDTRRCNALYCGGLGHWHKLYVFLLYIKGCLESWVQKIPYMPLFGDTSRSSYIVL